MKTGSAVRRMLGRKKMLPSARINNSYGVSDYEKELPHPTRNLTVSRVVIMLDSFEVELPVPALVSQEGGPETCRAVFIRAPAIVDVGASVELLAEYPLVPGQGIDAPEQKGGSKDKVVVAVKQNNMLATAFHPEPTSDLRWHSFFMKMISSEEEGAQVPGTEGVVAKKADLPQALSQVRDMPVFKEASFLSLELQ